MAFLIVYPEMLDVLALLLFPAVWSTSKMNSYLPKSALIVKHLCRGGETENFSTGPASRLTKEDEERAAKTWAAVVPLCSKKNWPGGGGKMRL